MCIDYISYKTKNHSQFFQNHEKSTKMQLKLILLVASFLTHGWLYIRMRAVWIVKIQS